jgi:hypothetical protein
MKTFDQVLESAARHGGVNLLFEKSMYSLIDDLDRIVSVLRSAQVSFEVVGGVAVNAYILGARRSRSFVTRDIDILVDRRDLDRIVSAAEQAGYTGRKIVGGFMLIRPEQNPEEAVHLLFTGEKPRTSHPLENPELRPEEKRLDEFGVTIPVAGLPDLVRMKWKPRFPKSCGSAWRRRDRDSAPTNSKPDQILNCFARISFMISDDPAPMVCRRASRHIRPIGYSVE